METNIFDGTKYDHSLKNVIRVMLICVLALYLAGLSWDIAHHTSSVYSRRTFVLILGCIPVIMLLLMPRWQLGPDALWQLNGKKKTVIAPYASIEAVRVIKEKRNGSKSFAINSSGKTYKLDVLQGEAFERELASHIGADKIVAS